MISMVISPNNTLPTHICDSSFVVEIFCDSKEKFDVDSVFLNMSRLGLSINDSDPRKFPLSSLVS